MAIWWEPIRQFSIEVGVCFVVTSFLVFPLVVVRRLRLLFSAQSAEQSLSPPRPRPIHWILSILLTGMILAPGVTLVRALLNPLDGKFPMNYPWYDPSLSEDALATMIQSARRVWRTYFFVLALIAWGIPGVVCILIRRYRSRPTNLSATK